MSMPTKMILKNIQSLEIDKRLGSLCWETIHDDLYSNGNALVSQLLSENECQFLSALYSKDELFRSRILMERYNFGKGEYKYFNYPLTEIIAILRKNLYPYLVPVANKWNELMKIDVRYPKKHNDFIVKCHSAGQTRPTPLLLRYKKNDYNCLHQDLYGELVFPLQVAVLLSRPEIDFSGGEFVLTEQRPRMQSRVEVISLKQGDAIIFAVHQRPTKGKRSIYRVNMRHGVSRILSGNRYTLGIIFHDAE